MFTFLKYWPRQIASPDRHKVNDVEQLLEQLNKINHIKRKIYMSIYNCDDNQQFNNAKIDKIAFDLDNASALLNIRKLHEYCKQHDYTHQITFSTSGFWFFIFTKNYEQIKNNKQTLSNAQKKIAADCNLTIGESKTHDLDFHIIGDVARVCRAFCSYDLDRKRYCIPLSSDDLTMTYEQIVEKSKVLNKKFYIYGKEYFDLKEYNTNEQQKLKDLDVFDYKYEELGDNFLKGHPPCIINMLEKRSGWKEWWMVTVFFKESCYPKHVTKMIMQKYLSRFERNDCSCCKNDFDHYMKHDYTLESVYKNGKDYDYPGCKKFYNSLTNQDNIYCSGLCKYSKNDICSLLYKS